MGVRQLDSEPVKLCLIVANQRIAYGVAKLEQDIVVVFEPLPENTGPLPPKQLTSPDSFKVSDIEEDFLT
jgi:hypothetical protein